MNIVLKEIAEMCAHSNMELPIITFTKCEESVGNLYISLAHC